MKIQSNSLFQEMMKEYKLPDNFSFKLKLPKEIKSILNDQILINDLGITLKKSKNLKPGLDKTENKSIVEDFHNHFHVDWYIKDPNNKKAFMLGVKTLYLLAEKFENKKIKGVRFWFSFQTPELAKLLDKSLKQEDDGAHYISDRLSFYTRRRGEEIINIKKFKKSFWAILIIDI